MRQPTGPKPERPCVPNTRAAEVTAELSRLGEATIAAGMQRFFKTGPGEYGEGDRFRGIRVPVLRKLARQHQRLSLPEIEQLLHSAFHEDRLLALLILIRIFARAEAKLRQVIYRLYLGNTRFINSWDLVDASAEHVVGAYLRHRSRAPLHRLARSGVLWERRIAILATFHFIKSREYDETLGIVRRLLADPEDLIHKAAGWMLREIGKRDFKTADAFLRAHYRDMPRTMLRYAIERFPEPLRRAYLRGDLITHQSL